MLDIRKLTKSFGALQAVDRVSLRLADTGICGLIGAWIKDRVGISHRLTKLETRQEILIDQHTETNRLLQEFLLEVRRDKNPN